MVEESFGHFFCKKGVVVSKIDVKDFICRPFCRFFKEGEKEEMECGGAVAVEELIRRNRLDTNSMRTGKKEAALWRERDPLLSEHVCGRCEFRIDGCDYMSDNPPPDAEPCGGNILLLLLLRNKTISARDLEDLNDRP